MLMLYFPKRCNKKYIVGLNLFYIWASHDPQLVRAAFIIHEDKSYCLLKKVILKMYHL